MFSIEELPIELFMCFDQRLQVVALDHQPSATPTHGRSLLRVLGQPVHRRSHLRGRTDWNHDATVVPDEFATATGSGCDDWNLKG